MKAQDLIDALDGLPADAARDAGFINEAGELTRDGRICLLVLRKPARTATAAAVLAASVVADADRRAMILRPLQARGTWAWPTSVAGLYLTSAGGVRSVEAGLAALVVDAASRACSAAASDCFGGVGHVAGLVYQAITLGAATWRAVGLRSGFEHAVIGLVRCPHVDPGACPTHGCPLHGREHDDRW